MRPARCAARRPAPGAAGRQLAAPPAGPLRRRPGLPRAGPRADAARLDGLLREIRLVRGLLGTDVPHAELIAADDTGDILGKPFYVMAEIDGWSPMSGGWQPPFDTDLIADMYRRQRSEGPT